MGRRANSFSAQRSHWATSSLLQKTGCRPAGGERVEREEKDTDEGGRGRGKRRGRTEKEKRKDAGVGGEGGRGRKKEERQEGGGEAVKRILRK